MAEANGMDIINKDIEANTFSGVYLLGGDETYLIAQYRNKLVEALIPMDDTMNYVVYKGENVQAASIVDFASTMPFFAERRVVVVEDSSFFRKGNEDMEELVQSLPETTVLVFVEQAIDKRCRLYKLIDKLGKVALFQTPDERTLLVWLKGIFARAGLSIEDVAVYRLLENVGQDMSMLSNEAEKLICYCMEKGNVTLEDVGGLSSGQIEGKIFEMTDALSRRDKKQTMRLYGDLLALREPAMRILFLITRQFQLLLRAKCAGEEKKSQADTAALLKVPPFAAKKYMAQCKGYTKAELLECVTWCQQADTDIKTGQKKDVAAVELLIIKLLR